MLDHINLEKVLFLDIETVPQHASYSELDDGWRELWDKKAGIINRGFVPTEDDPEEIYQRAGIYAEFGKIVCISVGLLRGSGSQRRLRLKSFAGDDEKQLLQDFANLLNSHYNSQDNYLCAHNGKEFDFPYIARRMLINNLRLPLQLDIAGKKPWEIRHLDTMELWKFGDFKSFTSLSLLAKAFGIPTPKDDIDGSDVWRVYWRDRDVDRIVTYCQKDVMALAQLLLRYRGEALLSEDEVTVV